MVTLRRNDRLKVVKTTIEIPVNLALEIFSETGDLPIGKYPAPEELAQIIAQVLNVGDETKSFPSLEAVANSRVMVRNEKVDIERPHIPKNTSPTWITKDHTRARYNSRINLLMVKERNIIRNTASTNIVQIAF